MPALLVLIGSVMPCHAVDEGTELQQALAAAGIKNPIREDLQRAVDDRLTKLEAQGIEDSGLFKGEIHQAHNDREVRALSNKLKPGDQLVLVGSDWKDAKITFAGVGDRRGAFHLDPSGKARRCGVLRGSGGDLFWIAPDHRGS